MPLPKKEFFSVMAAQGVALEYDEALLCDEESDVLPRNTIHTSGFSRNVPLKEPAVSSPMDTVTEAAMAIAMAKQGCLGIIHSGMTPEDQAAQVKKVRTCLNGLVEQPSWVYSDSTIADVLKLREDEDLDFHSFPVVEPTDNDEPIVVGLLTHKVFRFCVDTTQRVGDVMKREFVAAPPSTTLDEAYVILLQSKKKALLLLNEKRQLAGMYVWSDLLRAKSDSSYNVDAAKRLYVGAAVTVGADLEDRARLLVEAGVSVLVVDSAHGDTPQGVHEAVRYLKRTYPKLDVVGGNVSQGDAAKRMVDAGADGIRVGQSPGMGCITRSVAGAGRAQLTAVYECARAVADTDVRVCADGGIKYPGDTTKALAAGAHCVMIGGLLAGTDESPGEVTKRRGVNVKQYRGMGSPEAMAASRQARERYSQGASASGKRVAEGKSGFVQYRGSVERVIQELMGGLSSGMGYVGATNIAELQRRARFERVTPKPSGDGRSYGLMPTGPAFEEVA